MLDIQIAAAKTNKYASRESGDTVEVVERPGGGFTALLADGQGSGRASKTISQIVAGQAVSLLKTGVRDGAVARAAHDYLLMHRGGKVSAELTLLSVDLASRTVVLTRNGHCPTILLGPPPDGLRVLAGAAPAIGIYRHTRPQITEWPLAAGLWLVVISDGVLDAGQRTGQGFDVPEAAGTLFAATTPPVTAAAVADALLAAALACDQGRPQDDMSVLVLAVRDGGEAPGPGPLVRRMDLRIPFD
jgi:serine phosphatase RsbU (regulator of sigma subunit)